MLNFTVKGTSVGFCGNCGYVRQDTDGKPDTDCLCMAEMEHRLGCRYLAAISCKVAVVCEKHGKDVCIRECDSCNCSTIEGEVVSPDKPQLGSDRTPCTIYINAAVAHDSSWGQT